MPTLGLNPDPQLWLSSLITIMNDIRRNGMTQATFFPYRQQWWPANNEIWNVVFEHNFDYILRLDDDIWDVPTDGFSKLLQADKDVIGAAYPARRFPYLVNALNMLSEGNIAETFNSDKLFMKPIQSYAYEGAEPEACDLIGFGMTLIKVEPFLFAERPMYRGLEICPDDSWFAQVCKDLKIQQWCHWGVRLKHAHVTFENAGHLFNADVLAYQEKKEEVLAK